MNTNGYITYRKKPFGLRNGKKLILVQYEFSGIQSFIFGDTNLQSTRQEIQARSEYIVNLTNKMEHWLKEQFGRFSGFQVLSKSSGKLICSLSVRVDKKQLIQISDKLQRIIYASTKGKLEMHYGITGGLITTDKTKVKNHSALSDLSLTVNRNKFHCTNILGINMEEEMYAPFVFAEPTKSGKSEQLGNDGMWMAIKFDLDNLGSFFQQVVELDKRKAASEALNEVLNQAFDGIEGVIPIFVGGDDIFAIAKRANYLSVVRQMYQNIKENIFGQQELELYRKSFGISGGCALIRSDLGNVPLLYYFESSEEQLMKAKEVKGKNVLAIEDVVLSWQQLQTIANVFEKNREYIESGLDENQKMTLEINVGALRQRILNLNKGSKKKFITYEEERIIYGIG